jgi:hypothetical protein
MGIYLWSVYAVGIFVDLGLYLSDSTVKVLTMLSLH